MPATMTASHIWLDDRGVAWIDQTNVKVIEVALDVIAHGLDAEGIHRRHDGRLTLGQIHAALSHYHDNREAIDREIERQVEEFDRLRAGDADSPTRRKLRLTGRRP